MLVSLLFSLIVFSALSLSSPKMFLSFAYSISGNFKLTSINTYVTYSLNYRRKCSYNISFTDMPNTKVTQLQYSYILCYMPVFCMMNHNFTKVYGSSKDGCHTA